MSTRRTLFALAIGAALLIIVPARAAWADEPQPTDEHAAQPAHEAAPAAAEPAAEPAPSPQATGEDGQPATSEFDADGDGKVEPEEAALQKESQEAFAGTPDEITDAELDKRPADQQLAPSLSPEKLREMVKVARAKVLTRMVGKIEAKTESRMGTISAFIGWFSLAGLLLLLMPIALRKKYPGQGGQLFKYSALAALTFVVTVNLFGMVVLGFRSAQAALGPATNPTLRIASGFFDTIDKNADDYVVMGKELFAPTLHQLNGNSDEQPAVVLLENGKKLIKDADVFISIAKTFKKLDWVFSLIPVVLLLVTLLFFVLAIKPTLLEIVRLPATAAQGQADAGRAVVKKAFRRVVGEVIATACTLGVLVLVTLLAGTILGRVIGPALEALLGYFQLGIIYLQFVSGASSAAVFVMLLGVIVFLVLNLAVVILSMAFFLGKAQKVFQRRFNDGVPLKEHLRFWKWGPVSILVAQVVPWLYLLLAEWVIEKIDDKMMDGVTDASQISWKTIMLMGPLVLVVGFLAVFWAARGFKALKFLITYKVPAPPAPPAAAIAITRGSQARAAIG